MGPCFHLSTKLGGLVLRFEQGIKTNISFSTIEIVRAYDCFVAFFFKFCLLWDAWSHWCSVSQLCAETFTVSRSNLCQWVSSGWEWAHFDTIGLSCLLSQKSSEFSGRSSSHSKNSVGIKSLGGCVSSPDWLILVPPASSLADASCITFHCCAVCVKPGIDWDVFLFCFVICLWWLTLFVCCVFNIFGVTVECIVPLWTLYVRFMSHSSCNTDVSLLTFCGHCFCMDMSSCMDVWYFEL